MANDIGSIEGSVEAQAGGPSNDIGSAAIGDGGGGLGQPAGPTFISSPSDVALTLATISGVAATAVLIVGGAPTAFPMSVVTSFGLAANAMQMADVLQDSAVSAQFSMGNPGAFVADSQPVAPSAGDWSSDQSQAWYAQWTPDAGGGGNG